MPAGRRKKQQVEVLKEDSPSADDSDSQRLDKIIGELSSDDNKSQNKNDNPQSDSDTNEQNDLSESYEEEQDDEEDNDELEQNNSSQNEDNGGEFLPQDLIENLCLPGMEEDEEEDSGENPNMEELANVLSVFFHNSEGENVVDMLSNIKESIDRNSKCLLKLTKTLENGFDTLRKNK